MAGVALMEKFCERNGWAVPKVTRMTPGHRYWLVGSCAFYRPELGIHIAVERCANLGYGGRSWSWPGYTVDRTPYGVIQHELGHHIDLSSPRSPSGKLISQGLFEETKEPALTGYLGTDKKPETITMEWFAEIFRLFVTNPCLCEKLRPKFYRRMIGFGFQPVVNDGNWKDTLRVHNAPERIINQAEKKIMTVLGITAADVAHTTPSFL